MHISTPTLLVFLLFVTSNLAHPGEHEILRSPEEILVKRDFLQSAGATVARCSAELHGGSIGDGGVERRMNWARSLQLMKDVDVLPHGNQTLGKRDFTKVLNTNHNSGRTGLGPHPSDAELFTSRNVCVLQPEAIVGPYWVKGETVRSNIVDGQHGVPLYMEIRIFDTTTCKPLSGAYVDVWHANATGIYSGVVSRSNGRGRDAANALRTHNRGIQKTDKDGVVAFTTIFPGHYEGRTQHVHLIANVGASETSSGALEGGHTAHVGQLFFDQSLINTVEKTAPYNTNSQAITLNQDDDIMQEESANMDPVFDYAWLGSTPAEGLLAWITVGVDPRASYTTRAAATAGVPASRSQGGLIRPAI